jgi:hypothetical protein
MTTAATARLAAAPRASAIPGAFAVVLFGFAALHVAMVAYDLGNPERFLNADRAVSRLQAIERFVAAWDSGAGLPALLAAQGIPGDWLPQALLTLAGGSLAVILVQVLLALASIAWVREIGLRLGLPEGRASAAAILYGALPHTLVLPHQLSSEAIFVPLVVLSFALVLRGASAARHGAAGLAMGLAVLVRPITLAWPAIHALFAWRARPAARLAYLAMGLAPLALWMGFIFTQTGQLSMGPSKHDLGWNLHQRVQRMAAHLPPEQRFADRERLTVGDYVRFVASHPGPAAAHAARDMMALGVKSGVERVVFDYLDLFPESRGLQDTQSGWRKTLEQKGVVQGFLHLAGEHTGLIVVSAGGALLFLAFMALALVGAWAFVRSGRWMLVVFVVYVFATATAVDAAQSRHRAPAEFALCLLAVAGFWALQRRRDGR